MCASGADKQHRSNSKFTQGNLAGNMTNLKFSPTQLKLVLEVAQNPVRLWLNSLKAISSDHLQRLALKWARNMQITPSKHPLSLTLFPSLPHSHCLSRSGILQLQLQLSGNCYKVLSPHKASRSQEWSQRQSQSQSQSKMPAESTRQNTGQTAEKPQ